MEVCSLNCQYFDRGFCLTFCLFRLLQFQRTLSQCFKEYLNLSLCIKCFLQCFRVNRLVVSEEYLVGLCTICRQSCSQMYYFCSWARRWECLKKTGRLMGKSHQQWLPIFSYLLYQQKWAKSSAQVLDRTWCRFLLRDSEAEQPGICIFR